MSIDSLYVLVHKYMNPMVILLYHSSPEMQRYSSLKFSANLCSLIEFYAGSWYVCQTTEHILHLTMFAQAHSQW